MIHFRGNDKITFGTPFRVEILQSQYSIKLEMRLHSIYKVKLRAFFISESVLLHKRQKRLIELDCMK